MQAYGSRSRGAVSAIGLLVLLSTWTPVQAQQILGYPDSIQAYDPREVALLPPYCKYTQIFRAVVPGGNDQAAIDGWYARLGPTFHHMHHYCWGLMKENRGTLLSSDLTTRRFYLTDAVREYDYVIEHAPEDYVLLPEIITRKGQDLVLLGKGPVGEFEFRRAIALKPDYWAPYAYLSDYYRKIGETAKAREALQAGLAQVPGSEPLLRRQSELDSARSPRPGRK